MKVEEGFVIEVDGTTAKIKVGRHNECSSCGACPGDNVQFVDAINNIQAKVGDKVRYRVSEQKMILSAFIVFFMPLVLLFVFAQIALAIAVPFWVGIIVGLLVSGLLIRFFDKRLGINNPKPVLLEVI